MQKLVRKIHFILLICIVSSMPFSINHVQLNSLCIILFITNAILLIFLSKKKVAFSMKYLFILLVSFYFLHILGLVNTTNFQNGFFELQKKLSLLIFPVLLFFTPKLTSFEVKTILLSFVTSCLLIGLFCLFGATFHFIFWGDTSFFFYQSLAGIAGMHAIYLSMYCCFSIAILLYSFFGNEIPINLKNKIIYYSALSLLAVLVLLLSGRMQIIFLIIGSILYFIFSFNKNGNKLKPILIGVGGGALILAIMFLVPLNRDRFKEAINYHSEYSIDKQWGGRALRELNWSSAIEVIQKHPFTGVGTGDVQDELDKCYLSHNYVPLLFWKNTKFNAHDQFLETTVAFGIPGLILLLGVLIICLANALKFHNTLYVIFLILFIFSCLTESLLERQNGVVFYALFNSLFLFHSLEKKGSLQYLLK